MLLSDSLKLHNLYSKTNLNFKLLINLEKTVQGIEQLIILTATIMVDIAFIKYFLINSNDCEYPIYASLRT